MKTLLLFLSLISSAWAQTFPAAWWEAVPRESAPAWEILPQDARPGEVVLSKRTELGIFSNFAATPFMLDGKRYASVEGLWQAMKYPDPALPNDPRHQVKFPYTRAQVMQMTGPEAKKAGDLTKAIYRDHGFKEVSYGGRLFDYLDMAEGSDYHAQIIKRAFRAKLDQTRGLWDLLVKTQCLKLISDHEIKADAPAAYHHYLRYMELREERHTCLPSR